MGIEQASCLTPNVNSNDSEIYKTNKGINRVLSLGLIHIKVLII